MSKFVKIKTVPCPEATVTVVDSDNNVIGGITVPSGGSDTYTVVDSIIDIDALQWSVMASDDLNLSIVDTANNTADTTKVGNDIQIKDRTYNIYVNGALNQTFTAPAVYDLTINITA